MKLTAELFVRAGRGLFGDEWQNPLAALLEMNPRTVRRIAKAAREGEDYPINQSLATRLHGEMRRQLAQDGEQREARRALSRELYDVAVQEAVRAGQTYAKVLATPQQLNADREVEIDTRARALHAQHAHAPFDALPEELRDAYRRRAEQEMEADGDEFMRSISGKSTG